MRRSRFYDPVELVQEEQCLLSEAVSHHMCRVLRMKVSDQCYVFDGQGREALCEVLEINKKQVSVLVKQIIDNNVESLIHIHLAQGLCRGDKMDWVIQKAVELGANEITPILTEHSHVKIDHDRFEKKRQHFNSVMVSACEQSGRSFLPQLHQITSYRDFITQDASKAGCSIILDPRGASSLKSVLNGQQSFTLVVGPEGGFSTTEIELAQKAGIECVALGKRILRTETAALACIAGLQSHFDWV